MVRSYKEFCTLNSLAPWPATRQPLANWLVARMGQVTAATLSTYLSALRSVYVDMDLPTAVFDSPHIRRIMEGANALFSLPTCETERGYIERPPGAPLGTCNNRRKTSRYSKPQCSFHAGVLSLPPHGEFTWPQRETLNKQAFAATRPTWHCITMADDNSHLEFLLPRSKGDREKAGVTILVAASGDEANFLASQAARKTLSIA